MAPKGLKVGDAYVEIGSDHTLFDRGMGQIRQQLSSLGADVARFTVGFNAMMAVVNLGLKSAINEASTLETVMIKFQQVFGEFARDTMAWGEAFASQFGLSRQEMFGMLAEMQDTFVPMGFARKEAVEMSKRIVTLAQDLKTFEPTIKTTREALDRLKSGLAGNHEAMRIFGVMLTERALESQMMAMGLGDSVQNADEMTKVVARLAIVLKATADAQGNTARTMYTWDQTSQRLRSSLTDLQTLVGGAFMEALKGYLDRGAALINQLNEWIQLNPQVLDGLLKLWTTLTAIGIALAGAVALWALFATGAAPVLLVMIAVIALADALNLVDTGIANVVRSFRVAGISIATWWDTLITDMTAKWETFVTAWKNLWLSAIQWFAQKMLNMLGWFDKIAEKIGLGSGFTDAMKVGPTQTLNAAKASQDKTLRDYKSRQDYFERYSEDARSQDKNDYQKRLDEIRKRMGAIGTPDLSGLGGGGPQVPAGGVTGFFGGQSISERMGSVVGGKDVQEKQLGVLEEMNGHMKEVVRNTQDIVPKFS